jgi:hypothetical protein
VVALAAFVVESDDPNALYGVHRSVLEAMDGRWHRFGYAPDHQFDHTAFRGHVLEAGDQRGFHVGNYANVFSSMRRMLDDFHGPLIQAFAGRLRGNQGGSMHFRWNVGRAKFLLRKSYLFGTAYARYFSPAIETIS